MDGTIHQGTHTCNILCVYSFCTVSYLTDDTILFITMRNIMLGFIVVSILGVVLFTGQGSANSLDSSVELNQITSLKIFDDTGYTMMGMDLGTANDITSITLTFSTPVNNNETVNISLTDSNDLEIGVGSQLVSPQSGTVIISLSNQVTSIERDTLKNVIITIS